MKRLQPIGAALLLGCGGRNTAYSVEKTTDYPRASDSAPSQMVGLLEGFYEPESVRYDPGQDAFFVSCILGEGSAKDGNGYIVRVSAAHPRQMQMFAAGGADGVTLDAPKGLAIQGDTLWTTDIDVLRGFNRFTGRPVATIDLKPLGAVLLNDVAAGPDGTMYISDTGILMTDKGVIHVGGDKIFAVRPDRSVAIVAHGEWLGRPNGVTWDPRSRRWLVVTFDPFNSELYALNSDGTKKTVFARGKGKWDGLEMLRSGKALITSWSDSSLHLVGGGTDLQLVRNVPVPADLGVDTRRDVIAIPRTNAGRVELWRITDGSIGSRAN